MLLESGVQNGKISFRGLKRVICNPCIGDGLGENGFITFMEDKRDNKCREEETDSQVLEDICSLVYVTLLRKLQEYSDQSFLKIELRLSEKIRSELMAIDASVLQTVTEIAQAYEKQLEDKMENNLIMIKYHLQALEEEMYLARVFIDEQKKNLRANTERLHLKF